MNKLSIVVPVYNEEKNIDEFLNRILSTINKLNCDYEIIFALKIVLKILLLGT